MSRELVNSGAILRQMRAAGLSLAAVLSIVGLTGCETETPQAPSPGANAPPLVIETFSGSLTVGGSAFYSFNVPVDGPVSFTLLQYRSTETGQDTDKVASIGLGVPAGTTCVVASAVTTKAGNSPQFNQSVPASIYCMRITDPGQLEGSASFLINIAHPR